MRIKRYIQFSLKKRVNKDANIKPDLQIRMRVSFNSERLELPMGYSVSEADWDTNAQRVKKDRVNKKKETATDINAHLNKASCAIDDAFREFELRDQVPTKKELEEAYLKRMGDQASDKKLRQRSQFWDALDLFIDSESKKNSWQYSTEQKFYALKNHIIQYKANPRFEDFDDKGLTKFVAVLIDVEHLSNTTVLKQLGYLKWFLQWATNNKYNSTMDFKVYKPHLATTQKKVIFLTVDEIKKLLATRIPRSKQYLDRVRDVFVFCCFTGLRHSDVYNLKRSDVKGDCIEITTKKTADSLTIELNDVSKRILDKYKKTEFPDNKALPVISNQKMNEYLEKLCKLAGFDEEIRETTYQGNKRVDIVLPKYKLIKTHAGRRSFICNALAVGIPVNVVMKWTGHSDYKVMKPYIDVADTIKAKEMNKMNNLV